jgi:Xaa-Pro aminopeptidase
MPLDAGVMSHGSIPVASYAARLARTQEELARSDAGALLVGVGPDLRWLIGYGATPTERLTMLVLSATGRPGLIVPRLEVPAAQQSPAMAAGLVDLLSWEETEDPIRFVAARLDPADGRGRDASGAELLISDPLYAAFVLRLQAALPGARFGLTSSVLGALRAVKDTEEVELLRRAAHAADRVVAAVANGRLVGRSEGDVAREVRERLIEEGHDEAAFQIVASGPNSASPHHAAGERVIEAGQPIVLDIGGRIEGYGSDITRTIWVTGGDPEKGPDDRYRRLFDVLHEAQEDATRAARAGVACEEVDRVARSHIEANGFGEAFIHRTGHGIGLEGHEDPYLVAGERLALVPGHAFSVEPGIYLEGRYGARIEDIVVCTDGEPDVLNEAPRPLMVVNGT